MKSTGETILVLLHGGGGALTGCSRQATQVGHEGSVFSPPCMPPAEHLATGGALASLEEGPLFKAKQSPD